jgi:hypothetical protein
MLPGPDDLAIALAQNTDLKALVVHGYHDLTTNYLLSRYVLEQSVRAPGAAPRLAMLNGDAMVYAASLPKIAILLAALVEAERGMLPLDAYRLTAMHNMIRVSSNEDATRVLNWVGGQRLLDILQSDRFRRYDARDGGGLWVGKAYGGEWLTRLAAPLHDPVAPPVRAARATPSDARRGHGKARFAVPDRGSGRWTTTIARGRSKRRHRCCRRR